VARGRRRKVTSVDKANVLESSQLWRQVVIEVARQYPDVALEHQLVDSCAMRLVTAPASFDVVLTENLFGDILSDEAAALTGSLGMLPSATVGGKINLYEPIHGSAPDIAGKGVANPLGAIATAAMLLRHSLEREAEAQAIEKAIGQVLTAGYRSADLYPSTPTAGLPGAPKTRAAGERLIGTEEMGRLVLEALSSQQAKNGLLPQQAK
jgi:3-isopropylmalate dehydrogenase